MEDSLISRQAAIDEFDGAKVDEEYCTEYDIGFNDGIDFAVSKLSVLPSAQPEIIRCKDCKHWGIHKWLNIPWCREMHIDRGAEDFCSNAERSEDD